MTKRIAGKDEMPSDEKPTDAPGAVVPDAAAADETPATDAPNAAPDDAAPVFHPDHEWPSEGGSYVRQPDGTLVKQEG